MGRILTKLGDHPQYAEWMKQILGRIDEYGVRYILFETDTHGGHPDFPGWVDRVVEARPDNAYPHMIKEPFFMNHPRYIEWIKVITSRGNDRVLASWIMNAYKTTPDFSTHPKFEEVMNVAIDQMPRPLTETLFLESMLGDFQHRREFEAWIERLIEKEESSMGTQLARFPHLAEHPKFNKWVRRILEVGSEYSIRDTLHSMISHRYPGFLNVLAESIIMDPELETVLYQFKWQSEISEWIISLLDIDPNLKLDRTISEVAQTRRGAFLKSLCPSEPITTDCVRAGLRHTRSRLADCSRLLKPDSPKNWHPTHFRKSIPSVPSDTRR